MKTNGLGVLGEAIAGLDDAGLLRCFERSDLTDIARELVRAELLGRLGRRQAFLVELCARLTGLSDALPEWQASDVQSQLRASTWQR